MQQIKERPILFTGEMVRAILDGRKTQTRRVLKSQPGAIPEGYAPRVYYPARDRHMAMMHMDRACAQWERPGEYDGENVLGTACGFTCPYGQPGDRLWVRETWSPRVVHTCYDMGCDCDNVWVDYAAGGEGKHFSGGDIPDGWYMPQAALKGRTVPSLHMPRWASRITLEIIGVRVERLNDCSAKDAIAEGISRYKHGWERRHPDPDDATYSGATVDPRLAYKGLWESINGTGSWSLNPWVWVVDFRKV